MKVKKKHDDQFLINQTLKDEIRKKIKFNNEPKKNDRSQPMLIFKTRDSSQKFETNLQKENPKNNEVKFLIIK